MSLRNKLLLCIIVPIVALCAVHVLELQRVLADYETTLVAHRNQVGQNVASNLYGAIAGLDQTTVNLSHPQEIVRAVQTADNEVLFDWSHAFTRRVDTVLFADAHGMVLSRAPREFRFGDDVSDQPWFSRALREGDFLGLARVDGVPSLVSARAIRKYDDVPVGVVCAAVSLTPQWLATFTDDTHLVLRVALAGKTVESASAPDNRDWQPLRLPRDGFAEPDAFSIAFVPDPRYTQLLHLKESMVVSGIITALLTILAASILLSRQLRPYTTIVSDLLAYARDAIDLNTLHHRLSQAKPHRENELHSIIDALIRMIDTIKMNFERIETYASRLEELANTDALTGLHNRKSIMDILRAATPAARNDDRSLSILMLDIDHFKRINDTQGHQAGDKVLITVAAILSANCRKGDAVGRWGGEEFLVVCPQADAGAATALAERLRLAVAAGRYPDGTPVTVSLGVTRFQPQDTLQSCIGRVDQALYEAKNNGRNGVRLL